MFEHTDEQTDGQTDTLVTSTEIHDLENIDVLPIFLQCLAKKLVFLAIPYVNEVTLRGQNPPIKCC